MTYYCEEAVRSNTFSEEFKSFTIVILDNVQFNDYYESEVELHIFSEAITIGDHL